MWHYGYGMGGWAGFGWFVPLLFLIVAVVIIVYLVRGADGGRGGYRRHDDAPAPREDSAMRILRERYARGEIDREEFDQRKRDLS